MEIPFEVDVPATVTAGDAISGQVYFRHADPQLEKVKAVEIRFEAYVHGSGSSESQAVEVARHAGPPAAPGKIPFTFRVPSEGPISYQGRYVKIDWRITVTLDVAWAIDPKVVRNFQVVPRRRSQAIDTRSA